MRLSPWAGTSQWERWWAWYPIKAPVRPGFVAITMFEEVWRRRGINGKWEYKLRD